MTAIFISYRRADSHGATGRLARGLARRFGDDMVFRDQEAIDAGAEFSRVILDAVRAANAVLVVIGPNWLAAQTGDGQQRLEQPGDFVRLEIETAFAWRVPVVPVLVGGARMPSEGSLPKSIRKLAATNAYTLRDASFARDVDGLSDQLAKVYSVEPIPTDSKSYIGGRLESLRRYPANLARLVRRPKRFLVAHALGRRRDEIDALLFLLLSTVIAVWLAIAEWPGHSWDLFAAGMSVGVLGAVILSIPLCIAWRAVGAQKTFGRILTIFAYQLSVIHLGIGLTGLVGFLSVNLAEPEVLRHVQETIRRTGVGQDLDEAVDTLLVSAGLRVVAPLCFGMAIALPVWYGISWGAFRRAVGLSRWRSAAAFVITTMLLLLLVFYGVLIVGTR